MPLGGKFYAKRNLFIRTLGPPEAIPNNKCNFLFWQFVLISVWHMVAGTLNIRLLEALPALASLVNLGHLSSAYYAGCPNSDDAVASVERESANGSLACASIARDRGPPLETDLACRHLG